MTIGGFSCGFSCGGKTPTDDNSCFSRARLERKCFQPPPLAGNYPALALAGNYPISALGRKLSCPPALFLATHRLHKQALPAVMSTHQNQSQEESTTQDPSLAMPRRKIVN
jgi:hypothetical protein